MDLELNGLRVIVTGAGEGIGLAIARRFVEEGARVHVCDTSLEILDRLARSDPHLGQGHCDVADRDAVARYVAEAVHSLGGLDCLVNNAGIAGPTAPVEAIVPEEWDRTLNVNITGQFNFARLAVPHLIQSSNASLLNVSSAAGRLGFALRTAYAASKWAVIGFTKSLSLELGHHGIRANALLPGLVEGQRIERVFEAKAKAAGLAAEEVKARALSAVALRQLVTPRQLADMAAFLASPLARTVSGQAISVCGDLQVLV